MIAATIIWLLVSINIHETKKTAQVFNISAFTTEAACENALKEFKSDHKWCISAELR